MAVRPKRAVILTARGADSRFFCWTSRELARLGLRHELPAEFGVDAAVGDQFRMVAALEDAAVFEDEDGVHVPDRAQPVSDDEAGSACEEFFQSSLDAYFRERIDGARRLVEDQNPRIGQHRPREANQLALTE